MSKRIDQRVTASMIAISDVFSAKEVTEQPHMCKELQVWFGVGAQWADEDVLKMINDYVEDMRKYERRTAYENGFMHGVEKFAEYMTEKLTK